MNEYKTIMAALQELEDEFRKSMPRNTGNLQNSLTSKIVKTNTGFKIDFEMAEYAIYQDQGVNGVGVVRTKSGRADRRYKVNRPVVKYAPFSFRDKMPPVSVFSSYTSNLSEQFKIARSVYIWGIKPKNFIKPATDKAISLITQYSEDDIKLAMREQIEKEKIFRK